MEMKGIDPHEPVDPKAELVSLRPIKATEWRSITYMSVLRAIKQWKEASNGA